MSAVATPVSGHITPQQARTLGLRPMATPRLASGLAQQVGVPNSATGAVRVGPSGSDQWAPVLLLRPDQMWAAEEGRRMGCLVVEVDLPAPVLPEGGPSGGRHLP